MGHTQQVTKEFNRQLVDDDFTQLAGKWNQQSSADNLFIGTDRGFQVWRKNAKSGFVLLQEKPDKYSVFEVSVNFSFEDGSKSQSAGIVLQAQADGTGALIVEINRKKQYRIRRTVNNRLISITGDGEGWVKAKKAISGGENQILVRTYDKIYDLFINGYFVRSFTEIEYSEGKIGLFIGPESKVTYNHINIKTDDDHVAQKGNGTGPVDEEKTLSQIIVKLKESINKKDKRIAELEAELRMANGRGTQDTSLLRLKNEAETKWLQGAREIANLKSEKESLLARIQTLEEFKKAVKEGENGDIIINLTNLSATQKAQIAELQSSLRIQAQALEQSKQEKAELEKQLRASNSSADQIQNDKVELLQRLIEKDSVIIGLEEKIKLLDEAFTACSQNTPKSKSSGEGNSPKKKKKKKKVDESPLFDE